LERRRQGKGNEFPLPVGPTPRGDIPTVQCTGRSWRKTGHGGPSAPPRIRQPAGYIPSTAAHQVSPRTAHAPDGGGGGAPKARAGWGCRQVPWVPHLQGTQIGSVRYSEFWERKRQGRGNEFPLPVSPTPHGDIHHGPVHGEIRGKDLIQWPTSYTPDTAALLISPRTAHAPDGGGGGAPKARAGWGLPGK